MNNVQELLVAADMLQLTEVINLCCAFLKGQIDPLNCIGIFQFSEQIACHDLLEFTENYIHVHFLEVQSGEEFLALTKDQLIKILRSEELSIEDEYQVFLAAMQWLLKDLGKRKKYVVEVLDPIRFPLLPPQRLLKYIEGNFLLYISQLLIQWLFCFLKCDSVFIFQFNSRHLLNDYYMEVTDLCFYG